MADRVLELLSPDLEPLLKWVTVMATLAAIFQLPREKSGKHRHPEEDLYHSSPAHPLTRGQSSELRSPSEGEV